MYARVPLKGGKQGRFEGSRGVESVRGAYWVSNCQEK
jgi:hypothetical protein